MEASSDGNSPAADGLEKQKCKMKTPFQLEILEKTYKEASRLQLSEQLGLTDRQLKMWFCHMRLKDKKLGTPTGKTKLLERSRKNLMVADHSSDRDKNLRN